MKTIKSSFLKRNQPRQLAFLSLEERSIRQCSLKKEVTESLANLHGQLLAFDHYTRTYTSSTFKFRRLVAPRLF